MRLSKKNFPKISATAPLIKSHQNIAELPEKVLQFGTGVLLRGLPDFIINNANSRHIFNGKIVVVKSTSTGNTNAFDEQDNLFTLCIRGIEEGHKVEENHLVSSISRVLSATEDWKNILACAENAELQIIISNTTEVGLALMQDDTHQQPPQSFPGKLVAFLYHRYQYFNGGADKGMVIIPTELIPDNGKVLLSVVLELARQNNLENAFVEWVTSANYFCSSLVDRIVPGKLPTEAQQQMEHILGYTDELMIMSEPYALWAIETDSERVKEILSFARGDDSVVLAPDINKFRELKLRLLNGAHTFSCGLACLAGFTTVKEAMANHDFMAYLQQLMFTEIVPAICNETINDQEAKAFAAKVLDRFSNTFIEHKWLSITMQYSSKMNTRNAAVIEAYINRFNKVPANMALGMAAHILFMKGEKDAAGNFYGHAHGNKYLITDNNAEFYAAAWKDTISDKVVEKVLENKAIWQTNLSALTNFKTEVIYWLNILLASGITDTILQVTKKGDFIK